MRVPTRGPVAVGLNVNDKLQFAPAAIVAVHVELWLKSLAFRPPMLALNPVRGDVPELVRVNVCAELLVSTFCDANAGTVVGLKDTRPPPTAELPTPDKLTVWDPPPYVTTKLPARAP